ATMGNLSPALADELELDYLATGVVVTDVAPGSSSFRIGLRRGDVVLEVNGTKIGKVADLPPALARVAREWRIAIARGDEVLSLVGGG
ncbi:MAG: PDZ domain-containing protein, partial [Alphaproteobacteria bacterium]|nr:PDZ domain-containing protein [Alphaproteobacteria bacterium]